MRVDDGGRADALRAAQRGETGEGGGEPLRRRSGRCEEAELRRADQGGHRTESDADDRSAGGASLDLDAQAGEDGLRVACGGGECDLARVAAAVVEVEGQVELPAADAVQADAFECALDQATQDEQQGLDRVERVLERQLLADGAVGWCRREGALILAAGGRDQRGTAAAQPGGDLGGRQPGEITQTMHAPTREDGEQIGCRREAGDGQRSEESPLRAGGHDLRSVAVPRREPGDRHAGADPDARVESDAGRTGGERGGEPGLARGEMAAALDVEEDGAVGCDLDAAGDRRSDVGERTGGGALGSAVAGTDDEMGDGGACLCRAQLAAGAAGTEACRTRRAGDRDHVRMRTTSLGEHERQTGEIRGDAADRGDGKIGDEKAGDSRHGERLTRRTGV